MAQGFAHWNAADLKFGGDGILSKLFAFAKLAAEDFVPQSLENCRRQRLPGNGCRFFGRSSFCVINQAILTLAFDGSHSSSRCNARTHSLKRCSGTKRIKSAVGL